MNRSIKICQCTHFFRFLESNCNGCNVGDPKMVELLHLFAENGLAAQRQHGTALDLARQNVGICRAPPHRRGAPPPSGSGSYEEPPGCSGCAPRRGGRCQGSCAPTRGESSTPPHRLGAPPPSGSGYYQASPDRKSTHLNSS